MEETPIVEVKKSKFKRFLDVLFKMEPDKEIRYRGPFTYQIIRIIAWFCMAIGMAAGIINAAVQIFPTEFGKGIEVLYSVFDVIGLLPTTLFLLANFAIILLHRTNFKRLFITYISLTVVYILAFIFITQHYLVQTIMITSKVSFIEANNNLSKFLAMTTNSGITFNIFADILMCVLTFFFLMYDPKTHFQGKKIYIFRCFVALPIIYEVASFFVKSAAEAGNYLLPTFVYPFLSSKPLLMTIAFVAIAVALKIREHHFIKKGHTKEEYMNYRLTNRNSLQVSVLVSVIFIIVGLIDLTIFFTLTYIVDTFEGYYWAEMTGAGKCFGMILISPIIMLYSYTRKPKNTSLDLPITLGGVGLVAFTIIEGYFLLGLKVLGKS